MNDSRSTPSFYQKVSGESPDLEHMNAFQHGLDTRKDEDSNV